MLGVAAFLQVPKACPIEGRLETVEPHPGTELPRPGRTNRCAGPQPAFNPSPKGVHSPSGMGGRTDPPEISATTSTGLCLLGPAYSLKDLALNRGARPYCAEALLTSRVTGSVSVAWSGAIIALEAASNSTALIKTLAPVLLPPRFSILGSNALPLNVPAGAEPAQPGRLPGPT